MSERDPSLLRSPPAPPAAGPAAEGSSDDARSNHELRSAGPRMREMPEGSRPPDPIPFPSRSGSDAPAPREDARTSPAASARLQGPTFYVVGFWRRAAAALVDVAVIVPISLLLGWLAGALTGVRLPPSRHRGLDFWLDLFLAADPALLGFLILIGAIATTYALIFHVTMARTPGMILLKTRIIDMYGDAPGIGRSLARTLGYFAGLATLGLGFLWIGFDSEKRGLHDWLSGTYVVRA